MGRIDMVSPFVACGECEWMACEKRPVQCLVQHFFEMPRIRVFQLALFQRISVYVLHILLSQDTQRISNCRLPSSDSGRGGAEEPFLYCQPVLEIRILGSALIRLEALTFRPAFANLRSALHSKQDTTTFWVVR
jgi:hypothetical protein